MSTIRISDERLTKVLNYYIKHGTIKTCAEFELPAETISRYMREARVRGLTDEDEPKKRIHVLIFDIETSLMKFWAWSCGKQYLGPDQIDTDWYVYSWAAKWLYEPDVFSDIITSKESIANDDRRVIEEVWKYLDAADIVVAHNALGFDVRKLNARFIYYDMPPPAPFKIIDTLQVFRSQALFSSNKQDFLNEKLSLRRKLQHEGYDLWKKCFNGEQEALDHMLKYNEADVFGLEDLYMRVRPWIKSHPNMNLFVDGDGDGCPNCGSKDIEWIDRLYSTSVNQYSCFRCGECGAVGRARESIRNKDKKNKVKLTSIAR